MTGRAMRAAAAMEPGLRDRENGDRFLPGRATDGRRNGARPERPGKHRRPRNRWHRCSGRNGGRPERPEKLFVSAPGVVLQMAAMEHGLRDRENRKRRFIAPDGRDAAMEPGLRDRENRRSRRASATG